MFGLKTVIIGASIERLCIDIPARGFWPGHLPWCRGTFSAHHWKQHWVLVIEAIPDVQACLWVMELLKKYCCSVKCMICQVLHEWMPFPCLDQYIHKMPFCWFREGVGFLHRADCGLGSNWLWGALWSMRHFPEFSVTLAGHIYLDKCIFLIRIDICQSEQRGLLGLSDV